jgi:hypothetical protein
MNKSEEIDKLLLNTDNVPIQHQPPSEIYKSQEEPIPTNNNLLSTRQIKDLYLSNKKEYEKITKKFFESTLGLMRFYFFNSKNSKKNITRREFEIGMKLVKSYRIKGLNVGTVKDVNDSVITFSHIRVRDLMKPNPKENISQFPINDEKIFSDVPPNLDEEGHTEYWETFGGRSRKTKRRPKKQRKSRRKSKRKI